MYLPTARHRRQLTALIRCRAVKALPWIEALKTRRKRPMVIAVALANKIARIALGNDVPGPPGDRPSPSEPVDREHLPACEIRNRDGRGAVDPTVEQLSGSTGPRASASYEASTSASIKALAALALVHRPQNITGKRRPSDPHHKGAYASDFAGQRLAGEVRSSAGLGVRTASLGRRRGGREVAERATGATEARRRSSCSAGRCHVPPPAPRRGTRGGRSSRHSTCPSVSGVLIQAHQQLQLFGAEMHLRVVDQRVEENLVEPIGGTQPEAIDDPQPCGRSARLAGRHTSTGGRGALPPAGAAAGPFPRAVTCSPPVGTGSDDAAVDPRPGDRQDDQPDDNHEDQAHQQDQRRDGDPWMAGSRSSAARPAPSSAPAWRPGAPQAGGRTGGRSGRGPGRDVDAAIGGVEPGSSIESAAAGRHGTRNPVIAVIGRIERCLRSDTCAGERACACFSLPASSVNDESRGILVDGTLRLCCINLVGG